jgi:hypothetical protein
MHVPDLGRLCSPELVSSRVAVSESVLRNLSVMGMKLNYPAFDVRCLQMSRGILLALVRSFAIALAGIPPQPITSTLKAAKERHPSQDRRTIITTVNINSWSVP